MSGNAELLKLNIEFLKRVDLKGGEVPAYVAVLNDLNSDLSIIEVAAVPADPEEKEPEAA
jgi:hypothetical protein